MTTEVSNEASETNLIGKFALSKKIVSLSRGFFFVNRPDQSADIMNNDQ